MGSFRVDAGSRKGRGWRSVAFFTTLTIIPVFVVLAGVIVVCEVGVVVRVVVRAVVVWVAGLDGVAGGVAIVRMVGSGEMVEQVGAVGLVVIVVGVGSVGMFEMVVVVEVSPWWYRRRYPF